MSTEQALRPLSLLDRKAIMSLESFTRKGSSGKERLKEHHYHVTTAVQGHLGIHCRDCGCKPEFEKCAVVAKHREQLTREIIEANQIQQLGDLCVSMPSVALTKKEIAYLALMQ